MNRTAFFFLIITCSLCAGIYTMSFNSPISFGSLVPYQPEIAEQPQVQANIKDKILFVGDVMFARNVEKLMEAYGDDYPISLMPKLNEDTILIGNFESSIPEVHVQTGNMAFNFSASPKYIHTLAQYGFSYLGLANNHSYDFGHEDFIHTALVLSQASITPFGDPGHFGSTTIPLMKVGSSTVALIGIFAVNSAPNIDAVTAIIKNATKISDYQIVFIHWGDEYKSRHNAYQEKLAHAYIDAGADAIIGHHPHVVQDIDSYKNKIIFYSLGNFIFDQYFSDDVQNGLTVELSFASSTPFFSILPITSIGSRSAPRLMGAYERDIFLQSLSEKSSTDIKNAVSKGLLQAGF